MKTIVYILLPTLLLFSCKKDNASKAVTIITDPPKDTATTTGNTLSFSGYTWAIKNTTGTNTAGPGPNNWKGSNSYVDVNGYLHLKLTKAGEKWYCAEVTSAKNFGYGTYQWEVEGRIDTLDKNVVFGLFNYSGVDGYDEMDIEYSKFGNASANNTNFTIYPAQDAATSAYWNTTFKTKLTGLYTTSRFKRTSQSVYFQEFEGFQANDDEPLASATCDNPPNSISSLAIPVHMNLWLFQGRTPTNNDTVEIIIHSFTFIPE